MRQLHPRTRVLLAWAAVSALFVSAGCGSDQVVGGPGNVDAKATADVDALVGDAEGSDVRDDAPDAAPDATTDQVDAADAGTDALAGTDDASPDAGGDSASDDGTIGPDGTGDTGSTDDVGADVGGTDDVGSDGGGATDDVGTDASGSTDDVGTDASGSTDDVGANSSGSTDDVGADASGSTDDVGADASSTDAGGATDDAAADTGTADVPACTKDEDCAASATACATATCSAGACVTTAKADGTACDDANVCTTGDLCGAGKCAGTAKICDDANPCTDDSCAAGACVNVANGAACDDGNACTAKDACKAGACTGDAAAVTCDDGSACTIDSCDATAGCKHANTTAPCDDGSACTSGDACKDGTCQGGTAVTCDDGNACTTDTCDAKSGLCLFGASPAGGPCDDGDACTTADACNQGKCKGSVKGCDDGNPCTDDTCDPKAGCKNAANTATCDDGNACTNSDVCKGGTCAGAAKACDDGNPCTDDACDPKTGCTTANNTAPCSLGDACQDAACKGGTCSATGSPKNCDDGNPCTVDKCDKVAGCQHANAADGGTCLAGDACVNASTCQTGKCVAGAKANCDDGNPCTTDSCDPKSGCLWSPNTNPCDDGNACTVGDACALVPGKGPACVAGKPIDLKSCDDNNVCTDDKCDPAKGCVHGSNVAACNDGNVCTSGEACKDGKCQGGAFANCDDGKVCTTDQCDPATGNCSWTANTLPCNDGNACTSGDACAGGKCAGPTATACDDGNPCTVDSCDPATGVCGAKPAADGGTCEDGSACTSGDACAAGKCVGKATVNCDDANVCTDDACDAKTGLCSHKSNTAPCDDGNKCTTGDVCATGTCSAGKPNTCDDGNPCTKDSCDAGSGVCTNGAVTDGTACDDGIACTAESSCKAGACTPKANCTFLTEPFACNQPTAWTLEKPAPEPGQAARKVLWKIDNLALVGSGAEQTAHQCSLNFNNDVNYCDSLGQDNCQLPVGTATSPVVDWSAVSATTGTPAIGFEVYLDLDTANPANDVPTVTVRDAGTKAVLMQKKLSNTPADMKKWTSFSLALPEAVGHKFTVDFSLSQQDTISKNNTGAGFYVDNLQVQVVFMAEQCGDGIDNDGNGKADCSDPACASAVACSGTKLLYDDFPCDDKGWVNASTDAKVVWAVDGTPAGVKPFSGLCTLNYNNGTDYNAVANNQSVLNSGNATWSAMVDATGLTQLLLTFEYYLDTESGANTAGFDNGWVQLSTVDFADCKDDLCTNAPASKSFQLEKTNAGGASLLKQWNKKTLTSTDLALFAGKKFKVRFRFNTVDAQFNNFAGMFIDDVHLLGGK